MIILAGCKSEPKQNFPLHQDKVSEVGKNEWSVFKSVPPDSTDRYVLEVVYSEKYGPCHTESCMVVMKNDKTRQYKIIAPWIIKEIERGNIVNFEIKIVRKE